MADSSHAYGVEKKLTTNRFTNRYVIKNNTKGLVEVKLSEITNRTDSELYHLFSCR